VGDVTAAGVERTLADGYGDVAWSDNVVAIVTVAQDLPGALHMTRRLAAAGLVVSIGHTSAGIDIADAPVQLRASIW